MNFLAHLYLSDDDDNLMLGNFIADAVKGKQIDKFSNEIKKGIYLHREIDKFTDVHPIFKASCARLNEKYHKYSSVIVDMYYDHFLAKNWSDYSKSSLNSFVSNSYSILLRNYFILPAKSKRILPFIILQNWLVNYSNFEGLQKSFDGMARRAKFNSGMENAICDLKADYISYENEFKDFFPIIISFIKEKKFYI